jgi:ATP synthase F1 complex assembly factor 2
MLIRSISASQKLSNVSACKPIRRLQRSLSDFRNYNTAAAEPSSSDQNAENSKEVKNSDTIYTPPASSGNSSATVPLSAAAGSIIGKRFYKNVTTRQADDGNGWTVMLDYRTLKTPTKKPLKLPTLALAKAVAAEWEYQLNGIRPFTMPLMKLSCTALERAPLIRERTIENLLRHIHTDLVFCRAPGDSDLTSHVHDLQVEFMDPLFDWMEAELGVRPVLYTSIFAGKQPQELVNAMECFLKKTDNWELTAIDAIAAAAKSITIAFAVFRGRLDVEEAIKLIRLEEDLQVDKWGLVEGGHDVDMADLRVHISSAVAFLGLVQY